MRRWFSRRGPAPDLDPVHFRQALAGLPWMRGADPARVERLHVLAARFLDEKAITPLDGLRLNDIDRIRLAQLCCMPLLEFGAEGLHGWSELVVYPNAFRARHSRMDAHGILHEEEAELIGEAWERGPVILSHADVRADMAAPWEGYCVAVHEMAHKLDALDGAMDGTPPLPRAWQRQWADDFQRAFDGFVAATDATDASDAGDPGDADDAPERTHGDGAIDPYAAESPEEFFAVCSEYHFSAPAVLAVQMPAVAAHLARLYGPAPRA